LANDLEQSAVIACPFFIKPPKNAFDVFGQVPEKFKNITSQYGTRDRQKFQLLRQVEDLVVLKGLSGRHDLQILVRLSQLKLNKLFSGMDPQIGGTLLPEMGSGLLIKEVPDLVKFKLNGCG
jgi:hypothetical protein